MPPTESETRDFSPLRAHAIFIANVTTQAGGKRTCTISPLPTSETALLEKWIAAKDDSFVRLEEMR